VSAFEQLTSARRMGKLARMRMTAMLLVCVAACAVDPADADDDAASSDVGVDESSSGTDAQGSSGSDSTGAPLEGYDDPALWLCHAGKPVAEDQCLSADLTATELLADGSTAIVQHEIAQDPGFDCFYIYPTVDIRFQPGQTEDFEDIEQELDPLLSQAARFTSMCRVFAPLYHQITIGTFGSAEADALLDSAYGDIAAAFESYLAREGGERSFVLMGHSQGTYMATRLLQEVIEPDPALRDRMLTALLVGGSFSVPFGETVGGTSPSIPLCESDDQIGCVIAYRSYAEELPPEPGNQGPDIAGNDVACTGPVVAGASTRFAGGFFPTVTHQEAVFPSLDFGQPIDTPFVLMRDYYEGACTPDSDGFGFLAIASAPAGGDMRSPAVDIDNPLLNPGFLGLHIFDYNFAQQDLLDAVAAKAAAKGL
jgi:hypothetical protein